MMMNVSSQPSASNLAIALPWMRNVNQELTKHVETPTVAEKEGLVRSKWILLETEYACLPHLKIASKVKPAKDLGTAMARKIHDNV
ncbi:MAG: hypothetical protein EP343_26525 [Deltaproteobacteria bacterium]|nr:MAG: hypothetical protein EP343_26525 [Deltaproteobacteria bacterium]